MTSETIAVRTFGRIQWGPVIAGVLCAVAVQVVLGLFGLAFGFASRPADSTALGIISVCWNLLVPLVAAGLGAALCVRLAGVASRPTAFIHGTLVWAIGLIAGAVFLTGAVAMGAVAEPFLPRPATHGELTRVRDQAAKNAAAASGLAGLAAIFGAVGAAAGAESSRRAGLRDSRRREAEVREPLVSPTSTYPGQMHATSPGGGDDLSLHPH